jgi:hypothetical protein
MKILYPLAPASGPGSNRSLKKQQLAIGNWHLAKPRPSAPRQIGMGWDDIG